MTGRQPQTAGGVANPTAQAAAAGGEGFPGARAQRPAPKAHRGSGCEACRDRQPPRIRQRLRSRAHQPSATSAVDIAAVKEAIAQARKAIRTARPRSQKTISDPVARKLVEWAILRSDDNEVEFARYVAFIAANPSWPSIGVMRRRAEAMLWQERLDPADRARLSSPRSGRSPPRAASRLRARCSRRAIAPARRRRCARPGATTPSRAELEAQALDVFRDLLTAADHKARMDMRLYAEDSEAGLRAAQRVGGSAPAIAKARIAVIKKAGNAKAVLDAVPARRAPRRRLHLQPRPVAAPRRQGQRGGRARCSRCRAIRRRRSTPTNGGSSAG